MAFWLMILHYSSAHYFGQVVEPGGLAGQLNRIIYEGNVVDALRYAHQIGAEFVAVAK